VFQLTTFPHGSEPGRTKSARTYRKGQRAQLEKELEKVKTLADQLLGEWGNLATEENKLFLKEKLNELAKRRKELESGLEDVELTIGEIERESVSKDLVRLALSNIMDVRGRPPADKANPDIPEPDFPRPGAGQSDASAAEVAPFSSRYRCPDWRSPLLPEDDRTQVAGFARFISTKIAKGTSPRCRENRPFL
jgi:hypothetical protein